MALPPQMHRSCEEKETDSIPCISSEKWKKSSETWHLLSEILKVLSEMWIAVSEIWIWTVASEIWIWIVASEIWIWIWILVCEIWIIISKIWIWKLLSEIWFVLSGFWKVWRKKRLILGAARRTLLEKAEQNMPSEEIERHMEEIKRDLEGIERKVEVLGRYPSPFLCETIEIEEGRAMALPPQMHRSCEEKETNWIPCQSCKKKHVTVGAATRDLLEKAEQNMPLEELKRKVEVLGRKLEKCVVFRSFEPLTGHQPPQSGSSHDPGFTNMVLMIAAEDGPNGGPSMPVLVHRDILVSRSPVFKAMLENEMKESRSGTIKVSDMSNAALQAFVFFLHAEACVNEQMACELLVSAEKYQVEHLKAYFEKFLVSKLNWDNSIEYYAFAHQHNAKHLVEAATSLISDNLDKLRKHQEYSLLVEEDPRLGLELLEACLVRQENNAAL